MIRLDDVIAELSRHHQDADLDLVRKAYVYSARAHRGQVRTNGEPYLTHPLEVSYIVGQLRLDTASVCAGLLHDTVEDTDATLEEVEEQFGPDIAFLVRGLTKLEKINFHSAEEAQAENFRKMLIAMSRDFRVILVKLADRLHNMRTLRFLREEKQKRIAQETLDIYAPLANRLGIHWIKTELEDQCFKYLYPAHYRELAEKIKKTRLEREQYIERVIGQLRTELARNQIAGEVSGRPKHLWSIRQKITKSGRDLDTLFDILAFRVLVDEVAECYEVLGVVHSYWKPVPGRFKDYIALPKENSYQSLHTGVMGPEHERIEIQIRTRDMHRTAEFGVAAHWAYKEGGESGPAPGQAGEGFAWLRQLLEWNQDLDDPTDFMETVKVDLFANEVYVFTPNGDVRAFPRGATPLDFAYAIHTDLGHECTGAQVNGSQVSLRYKLQNGDVVSIQRTRGSKPKPDWIKFVKTGRAATKIRAFMRQAENDRSAQIGHELLERDLKKYGFTVSKVRKNGQLDEALKSLKLKNERELLVALGYGKVRIEHALQHLIPDDKLEEGPKAELESTFKRLVKKVLPKSKGGVIVDGLDGLALHFPKCCAALKGDDICGYITSGRGVAIHRKDCKRILDYDPARRVDVRWDTASKEVRAIDIRVYSLDRPGLLAKVSQSFHNAGANITAVNCRTFSDHRAVNNFTVLIQDTSQLTNVMKAIRKLDGVTSVERVDD
ncbi:MAG: bifunctional (p)ppGpp synthetase/guanosine-3',5'-bis(diphosphate) 3'-pyrophosphohydrolase [Myxococcota bacterium]|nr:bifunctional (p)ppGpp synthetase/guanosine-3',5'-bis(diphosphate) 3'-pyrophosphohydrolase [Myxococcota bacterium]